jgi:hypothetical protein
VSRSASIISRPRCLAFVAGAALSLLTGCEEPIRLVVQIGLQADTCGTGDVGQISLQCSSTAGAWVSDGSGGSLDQQCVPIGRTQSLDGLREVFTGMDLRASPDEDITVDVALFAREAGEGCVPPDDLPADERPEVIMFGSGRSNDLSGSRGPVEVYLDCTESPERTTAEACHRICLDEEDACAAGFETQACQEALVDCQAGCEGEQCSQCTASYEACLEDSVDGSCQLAFERCLDTGEQPNACNFDFRKCMGDGCEGQRADCFDACPSPGCALFPPRR